jgi:mycothiol system anti-sigma-R factor
MSCGHPHEDDCASVLDHVYAYIDREMADDDLATVKQHLEDCMSCLAEYGLEQAVKTLVHRSCCETAPEELRAKVLQKIKQVQAASAFDARCVPEDEGQSAGASVPSTKAVS